MYNTILSKIQDDNFLTFGPIITFQNIIGVWPKGRSTIKKWIFYTILIYSIIFSLNMFINTILFFNYQKFINFVEYAAFPLASYKMFIYHRNYKTWNILYDLILDIENESTIDLKNVHSKVVFNYSKRCHNIILSYWIFVFGSITVFTISFLVNNLIFPLFAKQPDQLYYIVLFYIWLPVDETAFSGRAIHTTLQIIYVLIITSFFCILDGLLACTTTFIAGQLHALRVRCVHALDDLTEDVCYENIVKCHQHYMQILKCFKLADSLSSATLFIYVLLVSVNFGVAIILFSQTADNNLEWVIFLLIMVGLLIQLFFYNSMANEIIVQSELLCYGMFESSWVCRSAVVRRCLLLWTTGARQRLAFTAGPFHEMSLATFVSILRASYSFYTLLKVRE